MHVYRDRTTRQEYWQGDGDEDHLRLDPAAFSEVAEQWNKEHRKHHAVDQTVRAVAKKYNAKILGYHRDRNREIDHSFKTLD